jgi:ABC-type nitrate/sulfonate/bicarbonate transport system permease component
MKRYLRIKISAIITLILAWHVVRHASQNPYIPEPYEVFIGFFKLLIFGDDRGYTLIDHALASLLRLLFGFGVACLV